MTGRNVADRILDHQRAELGRAALFRTLSLALQVLVAVVAAVSVFVDDHSQLLWLAIAGVLLLSAWFVIDFFYRRHRGAGDQARRLLLVINGLGEAVGEIHLIESGFTASLKRLPPQSIDGYFASRAPPGFARLGEMLDESAFFTADLQRLSGQLMVLSLLAVGALVVVLGLSLGPMLNGDGQVTAVRVVLSFLVLVVSSDVLGAAFGHLEANRAMEEIRLRLSAARRLSYPRGDVLQAMADYNAAVEGALQPLGFLYELRRDELDSSWQIYKNETGLGSAAASS